MLHFQKIRSGWDVSLALNAIMLNPQLWNLNIIRTSPDTKHHVEVDDILLRFNHLDQSVLNIVNSKDCVNLEAFTLLPQLRPLIFGLMSLVEGEQLGRVMITRLRPGGKIHPHSDAVSEVGSYSSFYTRYHIVLSGHEGSMFRAEEEVVCMRTGEVWWFDHNTTHEVLNNSMEDRIHLIVDIRTFKC